MNLNKSIFVVLIIGLLAYVLEFRPELLQNLYAKFKQETGQITGQTQSSQASRDLELIRKAYQEQRGDLQVQAGGQVVSILPDDNQGSRHQRFILKLDNSLTVLVAHNIDLAPRIHSIQQGDWVDFYGVYEYNVKGGVIHWTHHDPKNRHIGGWLKHQGQTYE